MSRPEGRDKQGAGSGIGREELLARAAKPSQDALRLHSVYRGKMQTVPKCPVRSVALSNWLYCCCWAAASSMTAPS